MGDWFGQFQVEHFINTRIREKGRITERATKKKKSRAFMYLNHTRYVSAWLSLSLSLFLVKGINVIIADSCFDV
jgi:hypothetical protein